MLINQRHISYSWHIYLCGFSKHIKSEHVLKMAYENPLKVKQSQSHKQTLLG